MESGGGGVAADGRSIVSLHCGLHQDYFSDLEVVHLDGKRWLARLSLLLFDSEITLRVRPGLERFLSFPLLNCSQVGFLILAAVPVDSWFC